MGAALAVPSDITKNVVAQYMKARELRDQAVEAMARWADVLVDLLGEGGECDGVRVQKAGRRFNADLAARMLPPDRLALICKPVPTAALARERLTNEELASVQVYDRPTVRLLP
jgi:hypothetical protein